MEEVAKLGKWLEFEAGTCFGSSKKHFGVLVGIDCELKKLVVAANATTKIEKLIRFADLHNIPVEDAMVDVTGDIHFSQPTGIDCHRAREISLDQFVAWVKTDKVRVASYNEDVSPEKYQQIVSIILRSPLIEETAKEIIRKSNREG